MADLDELEKRLAKEYKQASEEVEKKTEDYFARFKVKDAKKKALVAKGEITKAEYVQWRHGQLCVGERWKELKNDLAQDYVHTNTIARSIIGEYTPDAYALGHNFATYQVEHDTAMDTSYTLYNREAVESILKDDPTLLPYAPKESPKAKLLRERMDLIWNREKINSAIVQGILQGESIPEISKRLQKVTDMNKAAAIRNARTMMTSAENKGKQDAYDRLKAKGIDIREMWVATFDGRTRHSHRHLHGTYKDPKTGEYENGLRYPADPMGAPEEIYNCRCTQVAEVEGFSPSSGREAPLFKIMTYEQWRDAKGTKEQLWWYKEPQETPQLLNVNAMSIYDSPFDFKTSDTWDNIVLDEKNINEYYKLIEEHLGNIEDVPWKEDDFLKQLINGEIDDPKLNQLILDNTPDDIKAKLAEIAKEVKASPTINLYGNFQGKTLNESLNTMGLDVGKQVVKEIQSAKAAVGISNPKEYWAKLVSGEIHNDKIDKLMGALPKELITEAVKPTSIRPTSEWIDMCKNNPSIDKMLEIEKKAFALMSDEEKRALTVYTGNSYRRMNAYLRALGIGDDYDISDSLKHDIDLCHSALSKIVFDDDIVVRRGTDIGDLAGLFMKGDFRQNMASLVGKTAKELNDLFAGNVGTYFGMTSTSSQWNSGFDDEVEIMLYMPKGTHASSIMGISQFGTEEGETLLIDNTMVKCIGIEEVTDNHMGASIRVFLEVIPN